MMADSLPELDLRIVSVVERDGYTMVDSDLSEAETHLLLHRGMLILAGAAFAEDEEEEDEG